MQLTKAVSRKEVPGLTFIFSLPSPASSMADFVDTAPCRLWKPIESLIRAQNGLPLISANGLPMKELNYQKGELEIPFGELKKTCLTQAHLALPEGTPFEIRLGLPMGLDNPSQTFDFDLWRIGFVSHPGMEATKEPQGLRERFGYYLLAKEIAGTKTVLDIPAQSGQDQMFIGAERPRWADRFKIR